MDRLPIKVTPEELFPLVTVGKGKGECPFVLHGQNLKNSLRYQLFKLKGTNCVLCGLKGTHFYFEKPRTEKTYHLNLYGISPVTNEEILITKDHIIPRSEGGSDSLLNLQTMCTICNGMKASFPDLIFKKLNEDYENEKHELHQLIMGLELSRFIISMHDRLDKGTIKKFLGNIESLLIRYKANNTEK